MHPRSSIPTIALLGLGLTDCAAKDEEPTLVGTWTAIEVDMEKFPMVEMGPGYDGRFGYELVVDDELGGEFGYYSVYDEGTGITIRGENTFPITVDDADAPHYRITLEFDPYTGGYDGGGPDGALAGLDPALRGPQSLRSRLIPRAADERPVLDCQFAGDLLDCILTTPGEPDTIEFHFARKPEAT